MGPIESATPKNVSNPFYFASNMINGCYHNQIGMDYLCYVIFEMAVSEISEITFSPITNLLG